MNLPEFSVKRSVFAWMIMVTAIIFGAIGLSRLGVSYLPDVDFPVLEVRVEWPGTAPAVMESEIVDALEKELVNVEGVRDLRSSIRQGFVSVTLEFDLSRNIDAAMQEVQSYLSQVRLPTDVDPPVIFKSNPEDQPIMWLGLSGKGSLRDLYVYADLNLIDRFKLVPGVGEVILGGAAERNLRVHVHGNALKRHALTILDVTNALRTQHSESASGYIENSTNEYSVRFLGEGLSAKEVGDILIVNRGNEPIVDAPIRLRDVATIEDGLDDIRRLNSVSGQRGLSIGLKKQRGSNAVEVGRAIRSEIAAIQKDLPEDIQLRPLFDGVSFAEDAVKDTQLALIFSAVATVIVVWLFLGSLASTLNIGLAIPTSIMGTFLVLYFSGFTLNLFTLMGLSLAIGIVVDDAIMVLENIYRHSRMGKSPQRAAIDGTNEVFFAAIATTVVLLAIFIPVAFMSGITGRFFFQFAVTISAAVMLSTVDALTLTPMRASRTLEFESKNFRKPRILTLIENTYSLLEKLYERLLHLSLRFWFVLFFLSFAFLGASFWILGRLPAEIVPQQDRSQFGAFVKTPVDSSLESTQSRVQKIETFLQSRKEVKDYITIVGGFRGGQINQANVIVILVPPSERKLSQQEFMELLRSETEKEKGMHVALFDFASRGLTPRGQFPIEFTIRGSDWNALQKMGEDIMAMMRDSGLVTGVNMDYQTGAPEVQVHPNRKEAAYTGVPIGTILDTIQTGIAGVRAGRFTGDGRRYDVRVRLAASERTRPEDVRKLDVRNVYGELIPMSRVTTQTTQTSVLSMSRVNRQRSISITARPAQGISQGEALSALNPKIATLVSKEYHLETGGEARGFRETLASLTEVMILGLIVSYIVLAVQFNSFVHPITILLAVPFGLSGAALSLYFTGGTINLFSMIGMILLAGLATKNSIMIVEFANQIRGRESLSARDAILQAAPLRLRPIIMTSITAIAAAIPPAVLPGSGQEARIPMAIAVSGGIFFSTAFSLFVVPVTYLFLSNFERKRKEEEPEGEILLAAETAPRRKGRKK